MNIYFTNSLLLTPQIEGPMLIDWAELISLAEKSLSPSDQEQLRRLRSLIDVENARCFLLKEPLNPLGNWIVDLEGSWLETLPEPLARYIKGSGDLSSRLFSTVFVDFFAWDAQKFGRENFVGRYFRFELSLKWTLAKLRAGADSRALAKERDDLTSAGLWAFVEETLQSIESEFAALLEQLCSLYQQHQGTPLELLRSVTKWRLKAIEELLPLDLFSADHLLGLCAQMMIATDWRRMDRNVGLTALRAMRSQEAQSMSI